MNDSNRNDGTSHRRKRPHKRNPETVKRKNKERKLRRRKLEKEFSAVVVEEEGSMSDPICPALVPLERENEEEIEEKEAEKMGKEDTNKHANTTLTTKAMFKRIAGRKEIKFKFKCLLGGKSHKKYDEEEEESYEARELKKERKRVDRLQIRLHQMKDEFTQMKARHAECLHETQSSVVYARSTLMIENAVFSGKFCMHETAFDEYAVTFHNKADIMEINDLSLVLDTPAYTVWHIKSNNFALKSYKGGSKAPSEYRVLAFLHNSSKSARKLFPEPIAVSIDGANQELVMSFEDFDISSMTSAKSAMRNNSILDDEWLVVVILMGTIMLVAHECEIVLNSLWFDSLTVGSNDSGNKEPRLLEYWNVCTIQKAKKLTLKQQTKYSECPFMAPELVSGRRAPSYQSDMFAFGALLKSIDFKRKLPKDLKELSLRCTAVSVEDRPTSEEIHNTLCDLL